MLQYPEQRLPMESISSARLNRATLNLLARRAEKDWKRVLWELIDMSRVSHNQKTKKQSDSFKLIFRCWYFRLAGIEEGDDYWEDVVEKIHIMSEKYGKNQFVDHILIAYADYLDNDQKAKHLKEGKKNE